MSVNAPPNPNISTFNNEYWNTVDAPLTQAEADLRYLKFPVAQGTENLQAVNISGTTTISGAINSSGSNTFTGTNSFSNTTTISGAINSSGSNTFTGDNTFTDPSGNTVIEGMNTTYTSADFVNEVIGIGSYPATTYTPAPTMGLALSKNLSPNILETLIVPNSVSVIEQTPSGDIVMELSAGEINCSGTIGLTFSINSSYIYQVSSVSSLSAIDNSTIVPTTSWVQSSSRSFLALPMSNTTTANNAAYKYIFLTGNGAGGTSLLQAAASGTEQTFRRVNNTAAANIYTINCDPGITIISAPTGTTVTTFSMTALIYSVTFVYYNTVWYVTSQVP